MYLLVRSCIPLRTMRKREQCHLCVTEYQDQSRACLKGSVHLQNRNVCIPPPVVHIELLWLHECLQGECFFLFGQLSIICILLFIYFVFNRLMHTLPLVCRTWCRPAGDTGWWRGSAARSLSRCSPGRSLCSGETRGGWSLLRPPESPSPRWERAEPLPA